MQIKASLKAHKNGFYVVFTPGMRVSMVQGEYGYEPRRPHMTAAQKQEFASASAGVTYNALIDALAPLGAELQALKCAPCDIYSIVDTVMMMRSLVRGKALECLSEAQYGRINGIMGIAPEPISTDDKQFWDDMACARTHSPAFDFDNAIRDMGQNER